MQEDFSKNYKISSKSLVYEFAKSGKLVFFFGIFSTLATAFIVLSFGYSVRNIINAISISDNKAVHCGMFLFLLTAILMCIFSFLRSFLMNLLAEKFCNKKKLEVFSKILNSKMKSVYKIGNEKLISVISSDITQIRLAFGTSFPFFVRSSFTLIGSLSLLFYISALLTCYTIGTILLFLLPAFGLKKSLKKATRDAKQFKENSDSHSFDSIINLRLIKSFSGEISEKNIYAKYLNFTFIAENKRLIIRSIFISMCILAVVAGILVSIHFGIIQIKSGEITSGDLTAFMLYSIMVALGLSGAGEHGLEFFQIKRVWQKVLDVKNQLEGEHGLNGEVLSGKIEKISSNEFIFKHGEDDEIFIPKTLIRTRQIGLLRGKSGSGKSSFFDMLVKYNEVNEGCIFLNDLDIRSIATHSVRSRISYCCQNSVVMEKTLYENLSYSGGISKSDVKNILIALNLQHLTPRLNDKISNFSLSGGEKTRISIGMCLLKNADVFIFDEPTNGLDALNIDTIMHLILDKSKENIVIIASHDEAINRYLSDFDVIEVGVYKK